jgi:transposase
MFVRVSTVKTKTRTYRAPQIVESYRDPDKGPRTKVLAHLGQIEGREAQFEKIIAGLQKALGKMKPGELVFDDSKDFGHIYMLDQAWAKMKLGQAFKPFINKAQVQFNLEEYIKLMVFNRICDPRSKLGLLEWFKGIHFPGIEKPEHHHILRTMDWLIDNKNNLERAIWIKLKSLLDFKVELVFYDITSTYFEGEKSITEDDIRTYGYSRDHRSDRRQVVVGLVVSNSGLPICHHVFPGNTMDNQTVFQVVKDIKERFNLTRVIFVGDRGMISRDNIIQIRNLGLGYIFAHSLKTCSDTHSFIRENKHLFDPEAKEPIYAQTKVSHDVRYVLRYNPQTARDMGQIREEKLSKADIFIKTIKKSLNNPRSRMTPINAYAKIKNYLQKRNITRYYLLDVDCFNRLLCRSDSYARQKDRLFDGILALETSDQELTPDKIARAYMDLQEVERDFRCLKGQLRLRPNHHWIEKRIKAHIFICVLALQMERYITTRLSGLGLSLSKAIESLQRMKLGQMVVHGNKHKLVTTPKSEHKKILKELQLQIPMMNKIEM